jgi:hypothetical protein
MQFLDSSIARRNASVVMSSCVSGVAGAPGVLSVMTKDESGRSKFIDASDSARTECQTGWETMASCKP